MERLTRQPDARPVVLVVDDDTRMRRLLRLNLEKEGYRVTAAEDGPAGLEIAELESPDLILLDVMMPEMDGFETATLIREREKSRDTPIIFLTALSRSETNVFRGYELGAVDYIFKPFHTDILRSKVNVFVELFRRREAVKHQAQELAQLGKQHQLILDTALDGLVGIDNTGDTTFANPAAARMMGRRLDDIVGQEIHSLVHPIFPGVITCDVSDCELYAALRDEEPYFFSCNVAMPAAISDGRLS